MPNYQILNQIIVSGKPASPPRQITGGRKAGKYLLVLAVQTPNTPKGVLSFPIVVADELPECVLSCDYRDTKLEDRPTITVIGYLRTDNISLDLHEEVLRLARKANAPGKLLKRLDALLSKAAERANGNLRTRRVGTEIRAEQILQGGLW
jgi:hypothetical protein